MNFREIVAIKDIDERNAGIRWEIDSFDWDDDVLEHLHHGGFPDNVTVENLAFKEDATNVNVSVEISFEESVSSGCKDYNHKYAMTAYFNIVINKENGEYTVGDIDVSEHADEDEPEDFYPDDYR